MDEVRVQFKGISTGNAKVKFSDRIYKIRSQINKWLVGSPEGVKVDRGAGVKVDRGAGVKAGRGAGGEAARGAEGVEMAHNVLENTEVVQGALETNSESGLRIPLSSDSQGRVLSLIPPRVNGYPAHNTRFRKINTRFRTNKFSFRCAKIHHHKPIKFIGSTNPGNKTTTLLPGNKNSVFSSPRKKRLLTHFTNVFIPLFVSPYKCFYDERM